jgi:hypothetical protein
METANVATSASRPPRTSEALMTTIDAEGLQNVSLVIGTAFPVLAVAYYSAARGMLDDKLRDEGPEWHVDLLIPRWTRNKLVRFLVKAFGNVRLSENKPNYFPLNERFKLSTDRAFMLAMPLGFMLLIAYLLFSWRWALAASIVLLQVIIGILILFGTQVSMIKLASAITAHPAQEADQQQPPRRFFGKSNKTALDTQPMEALIRAYVMFLLLVGLGIAAAVVVELAKVRGT